MRVRVILLHDGFVQNRKIPKVPGLHRDQWLDFCQESLGSVQHIKPYTFVSRFLLAWWPFCKQISYCLLNTQSRCKNFPKVCVYKQMFLQKTKNFFFFKFPTCSETLQSQSEFGPGAWLEHGRPVGGYRVKCVQGYNNLLFPKLWTS